MTTLHEYDTVILGAGLCGLSAAYHLERAGARDYVVVEREAEVGGLARTSTVAGFSFDHAIHILFSKHEYAIDLICNELLDGNLQRAARRSYCHTAGVYTEYPYQANNYGLPAEVILENVMGLIEARQQSARDGRPDHFEAWIYQTFGKGIAENFMIPYNRRQWAWDLKEMNYDWIADRVPVPDVREVIEGALRPPERKYGPNQEFWYPAQGGIAALPRAFLRHVPGERLWLGATVVAVDGRRRVVLLADGRGVRYGRLISTLPLPVLVDLLGDTVTSAAKDAGADLKGNLVHTVNFGLEGADLGAAQSMHWIYFPEESAVFHRLSVPRNFSASMVPDGCSSIQVEISESRQRPRDRSALVRQSLDGLAEVGILEKGDARPQEEGGRVRVAQMVTLDPAYVIYDLSHRDNIEVIRGELGEHGITTSGRFGQWEYLNMDDAIVSGQAAAEEAAG